MRRWIRLACALTIAAGAGEPRARASADVELERVSVWGGLVSKVVIDGDLAFVAAGQRILVIDVTDPGTLGSPVGEAIVPLAASTAARAQDLLWDNNDVTPPCICSMSCWGGLDRRLLEDFVVDGDGWLVSRFSAIHHWNSLPPGSGESYNLWVRANERFGAPGDVIMSLETIGYEETGTGEECFSRPNYAAWADLEPVYLSPGTYWIEMQAVGPENNFALCADPPQRGEECWVNYPDLDVFQSSILFFGAARTVSFRLYGERIECPADVDHSGAVDFGDLLAVIAAWGACTHHSGCPEDVDDDGAVGVADLLAVLAGWGPCFER